MTSSLRLAMACGLLAIFPAAAQTGQPAPIVKPVDVPITLGFSREIRSRILGDVRRLNILLPEHAGEPGRRFPVVFLLDGGVAEDFVHVAGLTRITAAYGQGQEVILVGIEGVDRRHDLTSPSSVAADLKVAPTSGGADAYRRFLVDELKPMVAAAFPTDGRTAIMGESLAGLFVLETLLREPTAFDDYVSVSPSLWWDGGRLASSAREALRSGNATGRRLWLGFDEPAPPADQARRERALQDGLARSLRDAAPAGLWWRATRLHETHASIYHPAALQAFRALYGAGRRPVP